MIHPESKLAKTLASGAVAKGIEFFAGNVTMVEVADKVGFDFCMIDQHLSAFSLETIERMIEAARSYGMLPFVRVMNSEPYNINRILNMGVQGIIVPDVDTPEMAKDVVASLTFQPVGKRMACPMIRAIDYGLKPWKEYADTEAKYIASAVLIESELAVKNIDAIAATPGLDVILLGITDLALNLGIPGANFTHPVMKECLRKTGEACRKNNLVMFTTTGANADPEYLDMLSRESKMLCLSSDMTLFGKACKRLINYKEM